MKGYAEAHRRFGNLPWSQLFEPTIELCMQGFPIGYQLAFNIKRAETDIRRNKMLSSILINQKTNRILVENDIVKCEALARTLRLVSQQGAEVIYNGNLTAKVVEEVNANGGNFTIFDLKNYQTRVYENEYRVQLDNGLTMFAPPPPSSAILVAYILRIMSGFGLKSETKMSNDERNLFYHRFVEAVKHAFAVRQNLGDEGFVNIWSVTKKN